MLGWFWKGPLQEHSSTVLLQNASKGNLISSTFFSLLYSRPAHSKPTQLNCECAGSVNLAVPAAVRGGHSAGEAKPPVKGRRGVALPTISAQGCPPSKQAALRQRRGKTEKQKRELFGALLSPLLPFVFVFVSIFVSIFVGWAPARIVPQRRTRLCHCNR